MAVRFIKAWRMYQRGEVAVFETSVEDLLVSGGFAVRVGIEAAPDGEHGASGGAEGEAEAAESVPALAKGKGKA